MGDLQELTFLFDESIPKPVVVALKALKLERVAHFLELNLGGVKDTDWLRDLSGHRLVVLSNNHRILYIPHEKQALLGSDLGFIATRAGQKKIWQQARDILGHWEKIAASVEEARPFAYKLTKTAFEPHALT